MAGASPVGDLVADLAAQKEEVVAFFRGMPPGVLGRPCTQSEHPGGASWSPKDHLAHMTAAEENFADILDRALLGEPNPLRAGRRGATAEERDAYVNRENQDQVDARRAIALNALLDEFAAARDRTCALIGRLTNEERARVVRAGPGREVRLDAILGSSARHAHAHLELVRRAAGM
jgi:hypothetical protein